MPNKDYNGKYNSYEKKEEPKKRDPKKKGNPDNNSGKMDYGKKKGY